MNESHTLSLEPIGHITSPFHDKFGIPRQPNLIQHASGELRLCGPYNTQQAVAGLEKFSHIWIQFAFHLNDDERFRPQVRPPRMGGNEKLGVFATRSSFRPNNLGLTLLELKEIRYDGGVTLITSCPDLVSGTPIYDIKPYIEYCDHAPKPRSGYAESPPEIRLDVTWSETAQKELASLSPSEIHYKQIYQLAIEVLELDPRPAYKTNRQDKKVYFIRLYEYELRWRVENAHALIETVHIVKLGLD